jgi:hypothetical protein
MYVCVRTARMRINLQLAAAAWGRHRSGGGGSSSAARRRGGELGPPLHVLGDLPDASVQVGHMSGDPDTSGRRPHPALAHAAGDAEQQQASTRHVRRCPRPFVVVPELGSGRRPFGAHGVCRTGSGCPLPTHPARALRGTRGTTVRHAPGGLEVQQLLRTRRAEAQQVGGECLRGQRGGRHGAGRPPCTASLAPMQVLQ